MNIESLAKQYNVIYNRHLGTTLTLPHSSFDDIKIKQNDTVTNFNINNILTKLYNNFIELYKYTELASNIMPLANTGWIGVTGSDFSFWPGVTASVSQSNSISPLSAAGIFGLDTAAEYCMTIGYNPELLRYTLFASPGPTLFAFNINQTFTTCVTALSVSTIFDGSEVPWQQITDMRINPDDLALYVCDISANTVSRYDASGFLTDNNILNNTLVYQTSIGGAGTYDDTTKFNGPRSISYYNSEVYVLDAGNYCIKKYDKNLNWIITYRLFKDFLSAGPIQITHDNYGTPYVLTRNSGIFKYNNTFTEKRIIDTLPLQGETGTILRMDFSPSDNNLFYVSTTKNVYKRYVDVPDDVIGKYNLKNYDYNIKVPAQDTYITSVAVTSAYYNNETVDQNFLFMQRRSAGNREGYINVFSDNANTVSILTQDTFDVYTLDDIKIHPDEYLQNWVINKAISKLIINHMRLRDNITGKFLFEKDPVEGELVLTGTRYLTPDEMNSVYFEQDVTNYIGMNEIFQNNIINRPFEVIFNIQKNLLNILKEEQKNYYDISQFVTIG